VAAEHRAVCEATIARRADDAAAILEAHYRRTEEFVALAMADTRQDRYRLHSTRLDQMSV
jgi:DNA-binding GntR family transcriptional regulator